MQQYNIDKCSLYTLSNGREVNLRDGMEKITEFSGQAQERLKLSLQNSGLYQVCCVKRKNVPYYEKS